MVSEDEPVTPSELGDRFAGVRKKIYVKKLFVSRMIFFFKHHNSFYYSSIRPLLQNVFLFLSQSNGFLKVIPSYYTMYHSHKSCTPSRPQPRCGSDKYVTWSTKLKLENGIDRAGRPGRGQLPLSITTRENSSEMNVSDPIMTLCEYYPEIFINKEIIVF